MTKKQELMKLIVENVCEKYGSNSMCDGDCFDRCEYCIADIEVGVLANVLIDADYRRASEVVEEIFEKLKVDLKGYIGLNYLEELKKKYTKDGE